MPDWCECDLYIEGPTTRVEVFISFARGEELPFDFNRFIPYPEQFRELDRIAEEWARQYPPYLTPDPCSTRPTDVYIHEGSQWCVEHWGTKRNARNVRIGAPDYWLDGTVLEINFQAAGSPPKPVIRRAAELYPDLLFDLRYFAAGSGFEEAGAFNGRFCCEGTNVCIDERARYFGKRGG